MPHRLDWRLALASGVLGGLGLLVALWALDGYVRASENASLEAQALADAQTIARRLDAGDNLEDTVRAAAAELRVRVVVGRDGQLVLSSTDRKAMDDVSARATTAQGLEVTVYRSKRDVEQTSIRAGRAFALGGVGIVLLLGAAGFVAGRSVSSRARAIAQTTAQIRAGELRARTRMRRTDEIEALGAEIDELADTLVARLAKAQAEEARLRTILDSMVEGVLVTDRDGRIVRTNAALGRLGAESALGRSVIEAVRSPELHEAVQRALRFGAEPERVDVTLAHGGRTIAAHVAPLPNAVGVVVVLHDVTELRRADEVRRDFVANASHELRTPLAAIRGYAETLRDGAAFEPELSQKFLGIILEHSMRLERLVNDLLELSRAESLDVNAAKARVPIAQIVKKVVRGLEGPAAARSVTVEIFAPDPSLAVLGEETGIEHVVGNLIDNAIKYNREGGRVTVRVEAESDARVVLQVTDTGPGIAAMHLPRIFERFYRVDAGRSRSAGGTGLGLAIVKHHVQRMGGEISVESKVSEGTTFRVRLPRAPA